MSALDQRTRAFVSLAAAVAVGNEAALRVRAEEALAAGVPVVWGDELVLQSVLMVGYPRALVAAAVWRAVTGQPPASEEAGEDFSQVAAWAKRGEQTCRTIYGANYDKLRLNVRALHPALDAWMVMEGYGRTLSRPGLDLAERELGVVAQVLVLGAERQLHSHLRGARHAGATDAMLDEVIELAGAQAPPEAYQKGQALWQRIRGTRESGQE
ncbi:MAG: carboxymuconolactone decarboxylase family protein [Gemmatimonadales bacterium]